MERNLSFFNSARGTKKLTLDGYMYCKDKNDAKHEKRKCEDRTCKGRVVTSSDNRILKESSHNHGHDNARIEIQKSMARLKEAAMASDDCPAILLNKELKELLPGEFRGYWPNESFTKRAIQRHRRKFLPAIPKSLDEIQLDEQWQQSSRGEQWLLCDRMDGSDRLIIFCTERCLNIYVFLEQLRGEQAHTETALERLIAGTKPIEPRKKVKKSNERLFDLVQKYNTRSNLDYLRGIAYNFVY